MSAWYALQRPESDPEESEAARREMGPEKVEQEFGCSFSAAILGLKMTPKEAGDAKNAERAALPALLLGRRA